MTARLSWGKQRLEEWSFNIKSTIIRSSYQNNPLIYQVCLFHSVLDDWGLFWPILEKPLAPFLSLVIVWEFFFPVLFHCLLWITQAWPNYTQQHTSKKGFCCTKSILKIQTYAQWHPLLSSELHRQMRRLLEWAYSHFTRMLVCTRVTLRLIKNNIWNEER